jgi:HIRAN domain
MEEQNQSLIKVNCSLLAALSQGNAISVFVMPKDILVLETIVAGTSFKKLKDVEPNLNTQVKLELVREPNNEFDSFAIALYFNKTKIGYIPKSSNEVIARLLDAGKPFFATIEAKDWEGNWLKIEIKVFLKD